MSMRNFRAIDMPGSKAKSAAETTEPEKKKAVTKSADKSTSKTKPKATAKKSAPKSKKVEEVVEVEETKTESTVSEDTQPFDVEADIKSTEEENE